MLDRDAGVAVVTSSAPACIAVAATATQGQSSPSPSFLPSPAGNQTSDAIHNPEASSDRVIAALRLGDLVRSYCHFIPRRVVVSRQDSGSPKVSFAAPLLRDSLCLLRSPPPEQLLMLLLLVRRTEPGRAKTAKSLRWADGGVGSGGVRRIRQVRGVDSAQRDLLLGVSPGSFLLL